jgi:hypothetical protein
MKNTLFTLIGLLLAFSSSAQVPNYVPANGLVGYWPFSGNADDESGNGNDGTVNGAALTLDRLGNANAAYSFDGVDDYIDIGAIALQSFSLCTWINTTSVNPSNLNGLISNNTANFYTGVELRIEPDSTVMLVCGQGSSWLQPVTSTHLMNNTWYHITATSDNNTIKIYLNAQQIASYSITNFVNNTADFLFGTRNPLVSNGGWYTGKLDDIGIWDRALTDCEVQQLYLGQVIPPPDSTVTINGSTTFCDGGSVELSAVAGYTYLWSTGDTTQSIIVTDAGSYWVTVTDENCVGVSDTVIVTVHSNPTAVLAPMDEICVNEEAVTLNGGTPVGGTYELNNNPATELDPSVTGTGSQTVVYTYTDQNNCTGNAAQTIMVNSIPSVTLSGLNSSYALADNPAALIGTPSGGFFNGTGVANGMFDPAEAGLGTHGVSYAVVDGNGCLGVSSLCTTVDVTVGVDGGSQISNSGGLDIYPNPANGIFNVTLNDIKGAVTYTVFDIRGREVINGSFVSNGNHTEVLNLQTSADGVYTIQVNSANGIATQKLIKE